MVESSEVVNLIIAVMAIPLVLRGRDLGIPSYRVFMLGFAAMLGGLIVTIVEGFVFPDMFNLLEHIFYMLSGIFFAIGVFGLSPLAAQAHES